jgi:phenylacetate-CoA ligase
MNLKVLTNGAFTLLVKRFVGPFWFRRRWLERTQWLNEEQMNSLQAELLKRLVEHCYNTVPFWRALMDDRGIRLADIVTRDDIAKFPIISKIDVLKAVDKFVSTTYPRFFRRTAYTGGTTGTTLLIQRDLFSIGNEQAFVRRQYDWAGVKMCDKCAFLTGRIIVKPDQTAGRLYDYDFFMKELILSTYHLSPDTAVQYAAVMKKYGVVALVGYPSAVYLLAKTCLDSGINLKLKSVMTSSETLTESARATISSAFDCRVFNFYGGAERVCYIYTCEHGTYHVVPEYGLTELIPTGDGDDGICRVISTGFWNRAMPFIRYDTGDTVVKSSRTCPCGRAFPVVESITGRQTDVVKTPSGRQFGAAILTHLLYGTNHILESQIIQDALDHITIEYVPASGFSEKDLSSFRGLIVKHLPSELKVDLKPVRAVKKTSSGKIRPVVTHI